MWRRKWKKESEEIQYFDPTRSITFFLLIFSVTNTVGSAFSAHKTSFTDVKACMKQFVILQFLNLLAKRILIYIYIITFFAPTLCTTLMLTYNLILDRICHLISIYYNSMPEKIFYLCQMQNAKMLFYYMQASNISFVYLDPQSFAQ